MIIDKKLVKVGIIGPRSYSLGGHDPSGDIRLGLSYQINNIFKKLSDDDKIILGLTGLSLGVEQDFARLCFENNIQYNVYLSHDNQEKQWRDLPCHILEEYDKLINNSKSCINISDGNYSPKKHIQKQIKILKESDIIIWISGTFPFKNEKIQTLLNDKKANTIVLDPYAQTLF
jgi:kynureninase